MLPIVIAVALSGFAQDQDDPREWSDLRPRSLEPEAALYELKAGTVAGWTLFDAGSLSGAGLFVELDFHLDPHWFVFTQVRGMKFGNDILFPMGFLFPLSFLGLGPTFDDELNTYDLLAGAGAEFSPADWITLTLQLGFGIERYDGRREESLMFLGVPLAETITKEIEGNGFVGSLQFSVAFRLADGLDLDTGGLVELVRRTGYTLEGETDVHGALTLGIAFKF